MVVCYSHFSPSDYLHMIQDSETLHGTPRTRRTLHKNAVPSVLDWVQEPIDCIKKRVVRAKLRMCQEEPLDELSFAPNLNVQEVVVDNPSLPTRKQLLPASSKWIEQVRRHTSPSCPLKN
ncbi:hypothetical protein NP493_355g02009 [Ridgeia piscesae]|uniref:Uncharacterized protein n=1 Tax=Ridgeia piscesae TaxID=27915 RepID=A0AAD9L2Z3_RIDPI|nr:hypothetical protein NP493_355g02009 [Ridgeia piscesae]